MKAILQSEAFWLVLTSALTWVVNSVLTPRVAKLPPTHIVRRLLGVALGVTQAVAHLEAPKP
jgi:drug/metabolite transporter (DMT)-like permease